MHHSLEKNGAIFFWRVKPANPLPYILAQKVSTKVLMIPKGQIFFCIYHVVSYFRFPSFQFAITNSPCVISINIRFFFFSRKWGKPLIIYYLHAISYWFSVSSRSNVWYRHFFFLVNWDLYWSTSFKRRNVPAHALCEHLTKVRYIWSSFRREISWSVVSNEKSRRQMF